MNTQSESCFAPCRKFYILYRVGRFNDKPVFYVEMEGYGTHCWTQNLLRATLFEDRDVAKAVKMAASRSYSPAMTVYIDSVDENRLLVARLLDAL